MPRGEHYAPFIFPEFRIGSAGDFLAGVTTMRQTIKARYHDGVLQPLEPLTLADQAEVQVTVDTTAAVNRDKILRRATQVYQGLTTDQIAEVETIALDRRQFYREPVA